MKKAIIILLLLLPGWLNAQHKWTPWGVSEAGFIAGSNTPSGDLRLQGGLQSKGWMFGAGAAYDGYRMESIPVYAQVRRMFGSRHTKPFLAGSFGVNVERQKDEQLFASPFRLSIAPGPGQLAQYNYQAGTYADLGAGLAFRTHKKFGVNLSFSYSRKTEKESVTQLVFDGTGKAEEVTNTTRYIMNRYVFRIGMQL